MDMIAISTTWNSKPQVNVEQMLLEIKEAGFESIEIGYDFTAARLKELLSLVSDIGLKVVSVHNFCPAPEENPFNRFTADCFRLSSQNEEERRKAVDYTKGSIDTAVCAGSQVVVVHAGTVDMETELVKAPLNLYNHDKKHSKECSEACAEVLAVRQDKKAPYLENTVKSLDEVLSYASNRGIKIGLETRYYLNEIPNLEETEELFRYFQGKGLVYWHDIGHAEVGERLGVAEHIKYLEKFSDQMFGVHMHGLKGTRDHLAPFSGDFDFSKIASYLHDGLIQVIEAHPPATAQELKLAVRKLQMISKAK